MITLNVGAGGTIYDASLSACIMAKEKNDKVSFTFNGIELVVSPKSCPEDIGMIYCLKHELRRLDG